MRTKRIVLLKCGGNFEIVLLKRVSTFTGELEWAQTGGKTIGGLGRNSFDNSHHLPDHLKSFRGPWSLTRCIKSFMKGEGENFSASDCGSWQGISARIRSAFGGSHSYCDASIIPGVINTRSVFILSGGKGETAMGKTESAGLSPA